MTDKIHGLLQVCTVSLLESLLNRPAKIVLLFAHEFLMQWHQLQAHFFAFLVKVLYFSL